MTTYAKLFEARRLIDRGRRLLIEAAAIAEQDQLVHLIGVDPVLAETLDKLDDACGACPLSEVRAFQG